MFLVAEKENGQRFEMSPDTDFVLLKFGDDSPDIESYNEAIDGTNKINFLGHRASKKITVELLITNQNYREGLRKLNRFFITDEKIYLHYQTLGFRYVCQVQKIPHERWYSDNNAIVTIEFLCETPTKESVKVFEFEFPQKVRTLDGTWIIDGTYKLDAGFRVPFYFDTDSDVKIDPREYFLEIEFRGASNNLFITNRTTGDIFHHKGETKDGDVLKIQNTKMTLNGNPVIRNTNKQLISFAPGENVLGITNFSGQFKLIIRFRKQHY